MSRFPSFRRWLVPMAVLSLAASARGQQPPAPAAVPEATAPAPQAAPPAATPAPPVVRFYTPRTVLWLGRTVVIPFRLAQPAPADLTVPAVSTDYGALEILRQPAVLAGQTTGFLRVRGLLPGRTRLVVPGGAAIDLEIKPDPAGAAEARVDPESGRPRIISPSANAAVWGEFAVGVEVYDRFARPAGPDDKGAANGTRVQLRLPDGRLLDPVTQTGPELGPERHCQFNVQAADLPPGPVRLVAVAFPAGFTDLDRRSERPGLLMESDALVVDVHPVQADAYWTGECEDPEIMGNSKELLAPAHFAANGISNLNIPEVKPDAAASGGKTVACYGGETAWCLPFNVKNPGLYQLFVRTRGDFACGAYPSLGLYLGQTELASGTVRVSSSAYERIPVGEPVRVESGPRMFSVVYRNDFNHGKEDRNVYFDRWELARVGDLPPEPPKANNNDHNKAHAAPLALAANAAAGLLPKPPNFPALAPLPPAADLLYPANGASVFELDAVVARMADGAARAAWVDLLIDGQPQGERAQGPALAGGGPLVFPLLARALAPGLHRLALRVADAVGQTADSPGREFNVLAEAPAAPGPYARAVFLLDRLAFGPEPRELAAVLTQGESAWLAGRLASSFDAPAEQELLRAACKQFPQVHNDQQAIERALYQWLGSDNPVRSRFTAWTENHFSTWINKTEGDWKWREHLAFLPPGHRAVRGPAGRQRAQPGHVEVSRPGKELRRQAQRELRPRDHGAAHARGPRRLQTGRRDGAGRGAQRLDDHDRGRAPAGGRRFGARRGRRQQGQPGEHVPFRPADERRQGAAGFRPALPRHQGRRGAARPHRLRDGNARPPIRARPSTSAASWPSITSGCRPRTGWSTRWRIRSWPAAATCAPCCARWWPSRISGTRRRVWRRRSTSGCGWPGSATASCRPPMSRATWKHGLARSKASSRRAAWGCSTA